MTYRALASALFLLSLAASARAQTPAYTVTELGAFTARGMNEHGQVVGNAATRAVLYSEGVLTDITPPGGQTAVAYDINDHGQVAGEVFFCDIVEGVCVVGRTRGFVYDRGTFRLIGTLGGRDSRALGINNAGHVTGYSNVAGPAPEVSGDTHAFVDRGGVLEDIGARISPHTSLAARINDAGQVTGGSSSGAFVYHDGQAVFFSSQGFPRDINDRGDAAGSRSFNDDGSARAFLYSGGVYTELGTLSPDHRNSAAWGVNASRQVVGLSSNSWFSVDGSERAFLYDGASMRDLNALVPSDAGRVLTLGAAVNDAGRIACNGLDGGAARAFLLTPTTPVLLTEPGADEALALDSVTRQRGPFRPTNPYNFSADGRTRLVLLARNVELLPGETALPLSVEATNAQGATFQLPVEHAGPVPGDRWLTQIVVGLTDALNGPADLRLRLLLRNATSNTATIHLEQ